MTAGRAAALSRAVAICTACGAGINLDEAGVLTGADGLAVADALFELAGLRAAHPEADVLGIVGAVAAWCGSPEPSPIVV